MIIGGHWYWSNVGYRIFQWSAIFWKDAERMSKYSCVIDQWMSDCSLEKRKVQVQVWSKCLKPWRFWIKWIRKQCCVIAAAHLIAARIDYRQTSSYKNRLFIEGSTFPLNSSVWWNNVSEIPTNSYMHIHINTVVFTVWKAGNLTIKSR